MDLRKIDALVAEKVMRLECELVGDEYYIDPDSDEWERAPHYSTDIKAAWEVLGKFKAWTVTHGPGYGVICYIDKLDGNDNKWEGKADTAPLAICLAALKARGVKVKNELK